jgi:PAS domain S-box-containing protein
MAILRHLDPRQSLRARLALTVGIAALVSTLLLAYIVGAQSTARVKADKGALVAEIAHQMASELDRGMFERWREIRIFASLQAIRDPAVPMAEKRGLLERLKETYPDYAWIGFTDARGEIQVGTEGLLEGQSVAGRAWFEEGAKGPYAGDVHDAFLLAKLLPKPKNDPLPLRLVDVSAPIRDAQGKLLGVLCGHLSWEWAWNTRANLLQPLKSHSDLDLLVLNRQGAILLGTPALPPEPRPLALASVSEAAAGGNAYHTETWPDARPYLTGFAPTDGHRDYPGMGWLVLTRQPASEAFATAERLRRRVELTGLAFAVGLGALIWLVIGRVVQPLRAIARAADRIRGGDDAAQIPVCRGGDEVGVLGESLHAMVSAQREQKAALLELNETLRLDLERHIETQEGLRLAAQVFSSSTEGIIVLAPDETILSVNAVFCEITGYSREEAVGRTPRLLKSGLQGPTFYRDMWGSIERTGKWAGEIWNRRKNGEVYLEWLTVSTVYDASGQLTHYVGFFSDITERKRAEQAIRRLSEVVEQSPVSVVITDLDGNIQYVNRHFTEVTGYAPDEVLGRNPRILQSGETPPQTYEALWKTLTRGGQWHGELINRRKNGELFHEYARILPMRNTDGKTTHYFAVKEDITERRRMERELLELNRTLEARVEARTAELTAANQELEAFSYTVSHDLRAPLRAIDGYSSVLLEECSDALEPDHREVLGRVRANAQRMGELIDDLLWLSRVARTEMRCLPVDVSALATDVVRSLREAEPERPVDLHVAPGVVAQGDPTLLRVVLENLLGNAWKYTRKEPQPRIEVGVQETDGRPVYYVRDNGAGFDMAHADKLFGVFQRLHAASEFEGSGVGLASVKRILARHGGKVWARSAPGEGAAFYFTLGACR